MKISENVILPSDPAQMARVLTVLLRDIATTLNQVSEGRVYGATNAVTAAPTTGEYAVGDFVRNSAPAELGSIGSKYVLTGWVCTSSSPLTFKECRVLTGG